MAAVLRRGGRQGLQVLRLGTYQHRASQPRALLAADPPQPPQQGTRLLPLRRATAVPLHTLVKVAGRRWTTEENFQAGKGLAGLDEHQVRHWTSWYRWTTLAMLACAFLTITAAAEHSRGPAPHGQIPLTRNEVSRLFAALIIQPVRDTGHHLRWSAWRRRHQHRAQTCHYQRQARQL
jgi:hypothetical protein